MGRQLEMEKWAFGLYTTSFQGAGTDQRVAGFRFVLGGVNATYENDGAPFQKAFGTLLNDGKDRFRTNAVSVGFAGIDIRLQMFTGDSYGLVDKSDEAKQQGYPRGLKTGDGDMYRLGALTLGYEGTRAGWNSEGIRNTFQNELAHGLFIPQPYFRRLASGYPGRAYTEISSFNNPYSLWSF